MIWGSPQLLLGAVKRVAGRGCATGYVRIGIIEAHMAVTLRLVRVVVAIGHFSVSECRIPAMHATAGSLKSWVLSIPLNRTPPSRSSLKRIESSIGSARVQRFRRPCGRSSRRTESKNRPRPKGPMLVLGPPQLLVFGSVAMRIDVLTLFPEACRPFFFRQCPGSGV